MSAPQSMPWEIANNYARRVVEWLGQFCERIEVAGSVRRLASFCNDIDLVAIPKVEVVDKDLFGRVISERNLCWAAIRAYVECATRGAAWRTKGGDEPNETGFALYFRLPECEVDVFFATEETFASRLLCRTGSKEHNILLATCAKAQGMKWDPMRGILRGGKWSPEGTWYGGGEVVPAKTERDIYDALGLTYLAPTERELDWIQRNLPKLYCPSHGNTHQRGTAETSAGLKASREDPSNAGHDTARSCPVFLSDQQTTQGT